MRFKPLKQSKQDLFKQALKNTRDIIKTYRAELLSRQTQAEKTFSCLLDEIGIKYTSQKIFQATTKNPETGMYYFFITDFYLPDYNTVIEIDGKYHDQNDQKKKDLSRTKHLLSSARVKRVIRYTNKQVETSSMEEIKSSLAWQVAPFTTQPENTIGIATESFLKGDKKYSGINYVDLDQWRKSRDIVAKHIKSKTKKKNKQKRQENWLAGLEERSRQALIKNHYELKRSHGG